MEIWVVIDYAPVIFASRFTVRMFFPNVSTFVFFQGTLRQRLVTKLRIGSPVEPVEPVEPAEPAELYIFCQRIVMK